jgi:hypothetical protein
MFDIWLVPCCFRCAFVWCLLANSVLFDVYGTHSVNTEPLEEQHVNREATDQLCVSFARV